MRNTVVTAAVLTMLLLGMGTPAAAQDATPTPGTPSVVSMRPFTLDGRYARMSPDGAWIATTNVDPDQLCAVPTAMLGDDRDGTAAADAGSCFSLDSYRIASVSIDTIRWSPDSSRLAFSEDGARTLHDADIWVFTVATGEVTNLTDDGFAGGVPLGDDDRGVQRLQMDLLPAWSPDGRTIAFARSPWSGDWQGTQIATVPADGSTEAQVLAPVSLTVPVAVYFGIAYAPDGASLYFTIAQPDQDSPSNGIWRLRLSDGAVEQLAGRTDRERGFHTLGSVSPLGERVLTYDPLNAGPVGLAGSLFAYLNIDTGTIDPITASPPDEPLAAQPILATFSPDGHWLAFIASGTRVQSALTVRPAVDLRPENDTILLDGADVGEVFTALAWGANGTMLLMTTPESGYLLDVTGGNQPPEAIDSNVATATPSE